MNNLIDKNENIATLIQMYLLPASLVLLFIFLLLVYTILKQRSILKNTKKILVEHEEKIKYLRQTYAEYEYKQTQKEYANEKKVLELEHTIEHLEDKIKDGTKNQVVAKLEAYKSKREQQLKHINLG